MCYIYICVCVCVCVQFQNRKPKVSRIFVNRIVGSGLDCTQRQTSHLTIHVVQTVSRGATACACSEKTWIDWVLRRRPRSILFFGDVCQFTAGDLHTQELIQQRLVSLRNLILLEEGVPKKVHSCRLFMWTYLGDPFLEKEVHTDPSDALRKHGMRKSPSP
jgi:hypothetical protein